MSAGRSSAPTSDPTLRVAPEDRAPLSEGPTSPGADENTIDTAREEETALAAEAHTIDRLRESTEPTGKVDPTETAPRRPKSPGKARLPAVGTVIRERWKIERALDSGGMAHVFETSDLERGGRAALKLMDARLALDAHARERFSREAHIMLHLKSEHTVRVLDFGFHEDVPFLVMEYLEGKDLSGVLEENGPLPVEDACIYIAQACEALEEAHVAGIVHRDLKPKNLFLTERPDGSKSVRVLDFGIARGVGGIVGKLSTITLVGDVVGTLSYMAPEQARNARAAEPRSDLWALGACLYRLLTKKLPFAVAKSSVLEAILREPPVPITKHRPDVPIVVESIILRCLEKEPKDRYPTARALRDALLATTSTPLLAPSSEMTPEDLERTQKRVEKTNPLAPRMIDPYELAPLSSNAATNPHRAPVDPQPIPRSARNQLTMPLGFAPPPQIRQPPAELPVMDPRAAQTTPVVRSERASGGKTGGRVPTSAIVFAVFAGVFFVTAIVFAIVVVVRP